ncbi:MAG: linear amide C-N hydrolase [Ruminococcus sp.]|nr:linear amide C-N hydrolase [Ruminococcus sp.]MCM1382521.1 linear amide C-N hydrolase [Muribaculaceae bacterium]MCM1480254.1 linear amide C-N hydrolase [Muribaculaceae bacterium]
MKKNLFIALAAVTAIFAAGCGNSHDLNLSENSQNTDNENITEKSDIITLSGEVISLEKGLSAVKYEGDYGFDDFLSKSGAKSDSDVVDFLTENILTSGGISFGGFPFGCSTVSVKNSEGGCIFGRNFDWNSCNAMIVQSVPGNGYSSISTVNTDFINMSGVKLSKLPDDMQAVICLYAPLDGMNEKGLAVSVNMIQDNAAISQNSHKPDITTTTAIRLLLDKSANVDEALELLEQYDMHASMGYTVHLAIADNNGKSVAVEYVNNEMIVVETPVVTNFYLADGEKFGIGTEQSHERYDILNNFLSENKTADMSAVRGALDSVSKDNFNEFESTEWSVVFNQSTGEVHYYHRENYEKKYAFSIRNGE